MKLKLKINLQNFQTEGELEGYTASQISFDFLFLLWNAETSFYSVNKLQESVRKLNMNLPMEIN